MAFNLEQNHIIAKNLIKGMKTFQLYNGENTIDVHRWSKVVNGTEKQINIGGTTIEWVFDASFERNISKLCIIIKQCNV